MLKRTCIVLVFAFALTLGSALIATPTGAQDQTYYTYVSEWNVPRGQWAAFEKERDQQNVALQHLVADGTIVAWGNDANYVHTEDGYTHEDFFVATSRAGILKALDTLRPPATGGTYNSVTKHRDYFMHTLAHGGKSSSGRSGGCGREGVCVSPAVPGMVCSRRRRSDCKMGLTMHSSAPA